MHPEPVERTLREYRREGREEFLLRHPHPVLLFRFPGPTEPDDEQPRPFHTIPIDLKRGVFARAADAADSHIRMAAITKAPGNPWRDRISVGRARNNDLVVPLPFISKLHGYFTVAEDGSVTFTDAGSQNGSQLNGHQVASGDTVRLESGDVLVLGGAIAVFHTPRSLCGLFDTFA